MVSTVFTHFSCMLCIFLNGMFFTCYLVLGDTTPNCTCQTQDKRLVVLVPKIPTVTAPACLSAITDFFDTNEVVRCWSIFSIFWELTPAKSPDRYSTVPRWSCNLEISSTGHTYQVICPRYPQKRHNVSVYGHIALIFNILLFFRRTNFHVFSSFFSNWRVPTRSIGVSLLYFDIQVSIYHLQTISTNL